MERLKAFGAGSMDVAKRQHVFEAVFPPAFVTAMSFEFFRILKCPEKNVPQRNVGKVIGMMAKLMVNPVRLRALKNVTKP